MSKKHQRGKNRAQDTKPTTQTVVKDVQAPARDGYANIANRTGVGEGTDNMSNYATYQFNLITKNRGLLEAMYRGSWVVGVMIDAIAEDMTRAGIDITTNEQAKNIQDFQAYLTNLQVWTSLCDGLKWGRLYGGGIGVLQIEGQDLSTPLRLETIGKNQFKGLAIYDRWQLTPDLENVIPYGPEMGLPAFYSIMSANALLKELGKEAPSDVVAVGTRIHHTRIIRFSGIKLPFWQAITEQQWGMSEIERIYDRLISFDNSTMASAQLIDHAHLRTINVEGLREILSTGGPAEAGLLKMFDYIRLFQSNMGLTILDKLDTSSTTSYSFSGLSDMMLQFGQQLSGASGIPLVRLFGQSPAGLSATGESDLRNYYDKINSRQNADLRPGLSKLIKVAWRSKFGAEAPKDMQFMFTSLWQMTEKEKAEIAEIKERTVGSAFDKSLITRTGAMKELRQSSHQTGVFTNISDEDISEAESDGDVPMPGDLPELEAGISDKVKDSLLGRILGFKQ